MTMWYENENSMGIMKRKYLHEGEDPKDFIPRVASIFEGELHDQAVEVLTNADFLPAGRTLFGAGYKGTRKVSLSNCFLPGTKVLTTKGTKNIEAVRLGDMVYTSQGPHKVVELIQRDYEGDMYKLSSKDFTDDIICTPNHQFLTPNGWVRADRFFGINDGIKEPMKIKKVNSDDWAIVEKVEVLENQDTHVFNLSVDEVHEYNVNGVVCHNCFIGGTKVLTMQGFKNIENVAIGDYVVNSKGVFRVNNTMARRYIGDMYKLSSKDFLEDIVCTPNHQFLTPNGWVRADRFFSANDAHG